MSRSNPLISIVIPCYNASKEDLTKLYNSILSQSFQYYEVLIVDDCSDLNVYSLIDNPKFRIIFNEKNSGPAKCRNIGAQQTQSDVIFFTDSDCELDKDTLKNIVDNIQNENILMGNTVTKTTTFLGKVIAFLGFPGGGNIGFDKVWKIDEQGYTNSISSCNFAIKKSDFFEIGQFDIDFKIAGGEDTVFAKSAVKKGYKIKYCPSQIVFHKEIKTLKKFVKWQITRGKGSFYIKKKLGPVKDFLKLRLWSFKNSIIASGAYAPFVMFFIGLSFLCQCKGYNIEKRKNDE